MEDIKVAVVTGAAGGIGADASLGLLDNGYDVVMVGRNADALEALAARYRGPRRALPHAADVGDPDAVARLFARVEAEFGRIDLLFNNAGMGAPAVPMEEVTYAQWSAVVGVNLTGAFLCTQQAIRLMKKQAPRGGRIINNGSISAQTPRPFSAPYTATKHAITGLTKSTALDGRPYDIACGQIDIGNAMTAMTRQMAVGVPQANGAIAAEPAMDVRHVTNALLYMAGLPLNANVLSMTVMATAMPLVGRG